MDTFLGDSDEDLWSMLLGWIGLALAILSIIPNLFIVVILSKTKIISDTLVNFRSCAYADILCSVMFLVFIYPSWYQEETAFDGATCAVEGVLGMWMGLVLHYSLIYLMFQRYSQYRKKIGWKESKRCFLFPMFFIWLICGCIAVSPYILNKTAYTYNPNFSHCVLENQWVFLAYDIILYAIPSLLLFIAGTLLKSLLSKPVRRVKTSRRRSTSISRSSYPLLHKDSPRRYILIEDISTYYPMHRRWMNKKRVNSTVLSSIENHLMGLETRFSFIYSSYTSSICILVAFMFRMYGIYWTDPISKSALLASSSFIFAAGIARSIIPLIVSQVAAKHLPKKSVKIRSLRKNNDLGFKRQAPKLKYDLSNSMSRFVSFTLFQRSDSGPTGTHTKHGMREMENFWFKNESYSTAPSKSCTIAFTS